MPVSGDSIQGLPLSCVRYKSGLRPRTVTSKFVLSGYKWPTTQLSAYIVNESTTIPPQVLREALNYVGTQWSSVSPITFSIAAARETANIAITFCKNGGHGDLWPYDGFNPNAAHALYPAPYAEQWGLPAWMSGDIHINDNWQYNYYGPYSWGIVPGLWLFLHEVGHALGLDHSSTPGSVMYGYAQTWPPYSLQPDDIAAIQALYGPPKAG